MASQPDLWTAVHLAHIAPHMAGQPDARSSVDLARCWENFQNPGTWPVLKRKEKSKKKTKKC